MSQASSAPLTVFSFHPGTAAGGSVCLPCPAPRRRPLRMDMPTPTPRTVPRGPHLEHDACELLHVELLLLHLLVMERAPREAQAGSLHAEDQAVSATAVVGELRHVALEYAPLVVDLEEFGRQAEQGLVTAKPGVGLLVVVLARSVLLTELLQLHQDLCDREPQRRGERVRGAPRVEQRRPTGRKGPARRR